MTRTQTTTYGEDSNETHLYRVTIGRMTRTITAVDAYAAERRAVSDHLTIYGTRPASVSASMIARMK